MERLTIKNRDFWDVEHAQLKDGILPKWTHSQRIDPLEQALLKLAKFEDFMEEVGAESLYELENCIVDLKQEVQALKERWQNLKEWLSIKWFAENADLSLGDVIRKIKELEKE